MDYAMFVLLTVAPTGSVPRRREVRRDGRDGRADPLARARDVFANLADGATREPRPVHRRSTRRDCGRGYGPPRRVQTLSRLVGRSIQPYYTGLIARSTGGRVTASKGEDRVEFVALVAPKASLAA